MEQKTKVKSTVIKIPLKTTTTCTEVTAKIWALNTNKLITGFPHREAIYMHYHTLSLLAQTIQKIKKLSTQGEATNTLKEYTLYTK